MKKSFFNTSKQEPKQGCVVMLTALSNLVQTVQIVDLCRNMSDIVRLDRFIVTKFHSLYYKTGLLNRSLSVKRMAKIGAKLCHACSR